MTMRAQTLMQDRIDAEQWLSDVEYALRSIKACGSSLHCTGVHAGQLSRGLAVAREWVDFSTLHARTGSEGSYTATALRDARDQLRELLKGIKAELKAIGGVKQLRLALAEEGHGEFALAA
jgi:hypothetical protein